MGVNIDARNRLPTIARDAPTVTNDSVNHRHQPNTTATKAVIAITTTMIVMSASTSRGFIFAYSGLCPSAASSSVGLFQGRDRQGRFSPIPAQARAGVPSSGHVLHRLSPESCHSTKSLGDSWEMRLVLSAVPAREIVGRLGCRSR